MYHISSASGGGGWPGAALTVVLELPGIPADATVALHRASVWWALAPSRLAHGVAHTRCVRLCLPPMLPLRCCSSHERAVLLGVCPAATTFLPTSAAVHDAPFRKLVSTWFIFPRRTSSSTYHAIAAATMIDKKTLEKCLQFVEPKKVAT